MLIKINKNILYNFNNCKGIDGGSFSAFNFLKMS